MEVKRKNWVLPHYQGSAPTGAQLQTSTERGNHNIGKMTIKRTKSKEKCPLFAARRKKYEKRKLRSNRAKPPYEKGRRKPLSLTSRLKVKKS